MFLQCQVLYTLIDNITAKDFRMKLCLACFRKCEDSALSCPHCGYGSDGFIHSSHALPIGTVVSGRYETGKAEFSGDDRIIYAAFDTENKKPCRLTEYYPKNSASRKGRKIIFSDSDAANSAIECMSSDNPDGFRENGTFYTVSEILSEAETVPAKTEKKKKTSDVIRSIVYVASIVCLVVSLGYLFNFYVIEPWQHKKQTENLSGMLDSTAASQPGEDPLEQVRKDYPGVDFPDGMNPAFALLYSQNPEIAGWISIGGTDINYAVMQTDNNDKYLKTDFFGTSTNYGQPYFDYRNNIEDLDRNTIIHGHNMRHDDKIFGILEQYRNPQAFIKSPIIEMKTLYGNYKFKIYAVFIINSSPEQDNGNRFYYNFCNASDAEFTRYLTELDKRKLYSTGVDINEHDKIITLSTCCYDFYDARLAVIGRLIREGESEEIDPSLVKVNPNPKFPQAYYDAQKAENPYKDDEHLFMIS